MNLQKQIIIKYPTQTQKIIINNSFDELVTTLNWSSYSIKILIADPIVYQKYGFEINNTIYDEVIFLNPSEIVKNLNTTSEIIKKCYQKGLSRKGLLIGLGGGVIGDLVGFISSIYMRGVDYVFIPSSLMSQSDTIMQKVAVSIDNIKNVAGSFHSPILTYINTELLSSLPLGHLKDGLVECIKHAFLDSEIHIKLLKKQILMNLNSKNTWDWETIISLSLMTKKLYIESDPFDTIKNHKAVSLGHTFANAFEGLFDFSNGHGHAVAEGMIISSIIARNRRLLSESIYTQIVNLLNLLELPKLMILKKNFDDILLSLQSDKISSAGEINIVILTGIGSFEILKNITRGEILAALEEYYID
jgi:3-dehydroquinate synthase